MRVDILGGTGFVGNYVVDSLVARGHQPVLLVRPGSEDRLPGRHASEIVPGSLSNQGAVRALIESTDVLIYNIGILREYSAQGTTFENLHWLGAKQAMDIAAEAGGRRYLLMSANGVRADGTAYKSTKYKAEEYLRTTGLDLTIFRPSVIFGPPRGRMEKTFQLPRLVASVLSVCSVVNNSFRTDFEILSQFRTAGTPPAATASKR